MTSRRFPAPLATSAASARATSDRYIIVGHMIAAAADIPPFKPWAWEICRDGKPLPVRLRESGFKTEHTATLAGKVALRDFLSGLAEEQRAAPAAACRCRQAAAPGSSASAPSGKGSVRRCSFHRHLRPPCCASLAPTPSEDCLARQSLPSTANRPAGFRVWSSPFGLRSLPCRCFGLHPSPGS
jgi:hypothetical protein